MYNVFIFQDLTIKCKDIFEVRILLYFINYFNLVKKINLPVEATTGQMTESNKFTFNFSY